MMGKRPERIGHGKQGIGGTSLAFEQTPGRAYSLDHWCRKEFNCLRVPKESRRKKKGLLSSAPSCYKKSFAPPPSPRSLMLNCAHKFSGFKKEGREEWRVMKKINQNVAKGSFCRSAEKEGGNSGQHSAPGALRI